MEQLQIISFGTSIKWDFVRKFAKSMVRTLVLRLLDDYYNMVVLSG